MTAFVCAAVLAMMSPMSERTSGWEIGEPIVTYWAGPGFHGHPEKLTERAARQLVEGGFNVAWAMTPEELDVAAKFGLRVVYDLGVRLSDPKAPALLAPKVSQLKDHPALYLYHDFDEPSAAMFEPLAKTRDWLARADPKHALWLNLLPDYASNRQLGTEGERFYAYWDHVRLCGEIYRPEVISYDHYQFRTNGDTANYFRNLSVMRQFAAAQGIPFVNLVQACTWIPGEAASPTSPRIPGPDELRYLAYTTLAYGAQGICYYVYSYPGHRGAIAELDGTTGDKYEELKTLNRAFVAIAKELRPFRFVGAYAKNCRAAGTTPYGRAAVLALDCGDAPVLVSRFSASGRSDRFLVVNLDYRRDIRLTVAGPAPLLRFDAATGEWISSGGSTADLILRRGAGVLLALDAGAVQQVPVVRMDRSRFEIGTVCAACVL